MNERELIEKYKKDFMRRYRPAAAKSTVSKDMDDTSESGYLVTSVTSVGGLYPVKGAEVTVFTGDYTSPNVIERVFTNESGLTGAVRLSAPAVGISYNENSPQKPYSLYSIHIKADGYAENIHLNIPIFSGITSRQSSNLTPIASAEGNNPIVFNELSSYRL